MITDPSKSTPVSYRRIPVIGIVGGVGAGKSSVVRCIRSLRLHLIDADGIGHAQLKKEGIRRELVKVFGTLILDGQGDVDRKALANLVFGDSQDQSNRLARLNAIVHPAIRAEIQNQIQTAPQDVDAIILDAALLLESGWAAECHAVVMIDTPLELRRFRVAATRGWSADEHHRRESAQWSMETKRKAAQFVVDNSGTPEAAAIQLETAIRNVIHSFHSSSQ